MQPNTNPGKLIVLEGLDGAGTTTQAGMLANWLRRYKKLAVHVTREPTSRPIGSLIRSVLSGRLSLDRLTLAALFAADRLDHLFHPGGIMEHLQEGRWVILDRYYLSSFAYQSLHMTSGELQWLHDLHHPCLIPDITFFLDVPAEICMKRITSYRGANIEIFENEELLHKIQQQYNVAIKQLQSKGENIQLIDGTLEINEISKNIRGRIKLIYFGDSLMPPEKMEEIWERWPVLARIKHDAEKQLHLDLIGIKELVVTPQCRGGGFQLELVSTKGNFYRVVGYLNVSGETIKIKVLGTNDDVLKQLQSLLLTS